MFVFTMNHNIAVATKKLKMCMDEAISCAEIFMNSHPTHFIYPATLIKSFKIINKY